MQNDHLALLRRQLAQRPFQKQMGRRRLLLIGQRQSGSQLLGLRRQRLLLLPLIAAEIGGDGVEIVLRFSLMAVLGKLGKEADKGLLRQILRLPLVPAVEAAVFEHVAVIPAHKSVKRSLVALLHPSNHEKICVHGALPSAESPLDLVYIG